MEPRCRNVRSSKFRIPSPRRDVNTIRCDMKKIQKLISLSSRDIGFFSAKLLSITSRCDTILKLRTFHFFTFNCCKTPHQDFTSQPRDRFSLLALIFLHSKLFHHPYTSTNHPFGILFELQARFQVNQPIKIKVFQFAKFCKLQWVLGLCILIMYQGVCLCVFQGISGLKSFSNSSRDQVSYQGAQQIALVSIQRFLVIP